MVIKSKVYDCMVISRDLPEEALQLCAVACGVALNNYFHSAHMPLAVRNNDDTIFGRSYDVTQRVDESRVDTFRSVNCAH